MGLPLRTRPPVGEEGEEVGGADGAVENAHAVGAISWSMTTPFHLAIPVHDLTAARRFYTDLLGCREGRCGAYWVDFDFFGHQLVVHTVSAGEHGGQCMVQVGEKMIDGHTIPLPHFGAVLSMEGWTELAKRLSTAGVGFLIPPHRRYEGRINEQASMLLRDPSGNGIEFKAFADPANLFAT